MSGRKTPLDHLEEAAPLAFGRGAAISLDPERRGWAARVWDAKGSCVAEVHKPGKLAAINGLRRQLAGRERRGVQRVHHRDGDPRNNELANVELETG